MKWINEELKREPELISSGGGRGKEVVCNFQPPKAKQQCVCVYEREGEGEKKRELTHNKGARKSLHSALY